MYAIQHTILAVAISCEGHPPAHAPLKAATALGLRLELTLYSNLVSFMNTATLNMYISMSYAGLTREYVIRIRVAAPQEYVNTFSTRRAAYPRALKRRERKSSPPLSLDTLVYDQYCTV